jgi:hypothetical protein
MLTPVDAARPADVLLDGDVLAAVDFRSLPPGTELVVETCNARYRLEIGDDRWNAQVQGGRYFKETTPARIDGCTDGGSCLKIGWIAVGCCLELTVGGRRIVTSTVRSISLSPDSAAA